MKRVSAANEFAEWKRTAVVLRKLAEAQRVIIIIIALVDDEVFRSKHESRSSNGESRCVLKVPWPLLPAIISSYVTRKKKAKIYNFQIAVNAHIRWCADTTHFLLSGFSSSFRSHVERDFSIPRGNRCSAHATVVHVSLSPFNVTFIKLQVRRL